MSESFTSGFIAIVGRPNAGKSTLLNALIKQKVSIVSPKPQTTRDKVLGVWTGENCQMVFVDTPGQLKAVNALGQYMVREIDNAVQDVNCIVVVIDGHDGIFEADINLVEKYAKHKCPLVVVVNKTDISQPEKIMAGLSKLNSISGIEAVFPISAMRNRNIDELKNYLKKFMTDTNKYFEDDDVTDKSQRFITCELIREKMLILLDKEIPHGVAVELNKMEYDEYKHRWEIDANIIIERKSHKPIILGKNGSMIKEIGTQARKSIQEMLDAVVYLELWVKIKEDWRNSDFILRQVGYNSNEK